MDHAARDAGNYYSERNLSPQKGRPAPTRSTMASLCSWRHAHGFANLMKAMVGSGLLTLPWATAQVGVVVSVVGLALIAFLTQYAIRLLVRCLVAVSGAELIATTAPRSDGSAATSSHGRSWEKISEAAFGAPGVAISLAFLVSAQLGVCASYLAFFATQLHDHGLFSSVRFAVLGSAAVIGVVCQLRRLQNVALLSTAALLVYSYVLALSWYYGVQAPLRTTPLRLADVGGVGAWFGPSIFAFEGIGPAISVFESLGSDPEPFARVVTAAFSFNVVLYGAVAALGYAAWGDGVAQVLIDSFPDGGGSTSAELALSISLALSYAIQMTPVFALLEGRLERSESNLLADLASTPLPRLAVVFVTALAALAVPNMEQLVSLTGAVSFSAIGFVLPGLFFLRLKPPPVGREPARPRVDGFLSVLLVVLGVVGGTWGVITTLAAIAE